MAACSILVPPLHMHQGQPTTQQQRPATDLIQDPAAPLGHALVPERVFCVPSRPHIQQVGAVIAKHGQQSTRTVVASQCLEDNLNHNAIAFWKSKSNVDPRTSSDQIRHYGRVLLTNISSAATRPPAPEKSSPGLDH